MLFKPNQKYGNIVIVTIGVSFFSLMYLISSAFLYMDISSGSSRDMKKKFCKENPEQCKRKPRKDLFTGEYK